MVQTSARYMLELENYVVCQDKKDAEVFQHLALRHLFYVENTLHR